MKNLFFRCLNREDDQPLTISSYIRMRKLKIYKNLIFLSLSQSLTYAMYKMIMMLGEYEHNHQGIWSYTSFNFAKIFAFLVLPQFFLSRYKLQATIRCGILLHSLLIFILYFNNIAIAIPIGLLVGIISPITWVSTHFYIYKLSTIMSKISGDDLDTILIRFSGIFFSIYRSHEIIAHLPISFVPGRNETSRNIENHCGPRFYFGDYASLSEFTLPPRNDNSYIANLTVILLSFCVILISILIIDPPRKLTHTHLGLEEYTLNFSRVLHLFRHRGFQLMIPIIIFSGYEKTMKSYDFTTAYVGCTQSPEFAIYVYFMGSLASSQISLALAPLVDVMNFQIILGIAGSIHFILLLFLLLQNPRNLTSYYVISAMWGLASPAWDCLLNVLYGMLAPGNEFEAYSHLGFWYSVGTFSHLFLTKFVSVGFKIWTGFFFLLLAIISILLLPFIISYTPKKVGPMELDDAKNAPINVPRKTGVYFGKTSFKHEYNPAEVKSITTSRVYHVAIPYTRSRFDRHESSYEDADV